VADRVGIGGTGLCLLVMGVLGMGFFGCGSDQDSGASAGTSTLSGAEEVTKPRILRAEAASINSFNSEYTAFCEPKKPVRDFGLSELPPVREVPESAKGLGHGAVTMSGRVRPWVTSDPEPFGYEFWEYPDAGVRLDWTVTAQLWTIDRQGTALREVDHEELVIRRLDGARAPRIFLDPPEKRRGFYRFDMQIANQDGKVIGSYGTYFKVVRPSWGPLRLQLHRDVLRPGQQLLSRVANYGSEPISYGESFGVQRYEDGAWRPAPKLTPNYWNAWLGALSAGLASRCSSLSLPLLTLPGRYRVVKLIGTERHKGVRLYAPFKVVGTRADIKF